MTGTHNDEGGLTYQNLWAKVYPTNLEGFVCENSGPLAVFGKSNVSFIGFICFILNLVNNRG